MKHEIQSQGYSYWFANNYEKLVNMLAPCNLDILHDAFLLCQNTRGDFMNVTVTTYRRLVQQEANRSYRTFNPDPRFWQWQSKTLVDEEEPGIDYAQVLRRVRSWIVQHFAGDEREMLLMRLDRGASLQDIASVTGKSLNQVTHFFRRFRHIYRRHFYQI